MNAPRVVLASASPRRAELLRAAGIEFEVAPAHVDETVRDGEPPDAYVTRVAAEKARAMPGRFPGRVILAADTTVVVDHHILSKPEDHDDARRMLRLLSGRTHEVITGVALLHPDGNIDVRLDRTDVEVAPLSAAEIDWYVQSGEPMDKAGAYAIQGLASRFVTSIRGSYSNVVGLPVSLVYQMLRRT